MTTVINSLIYSWLQNAFRNGYWMHVRVYPDREWYDMYAKPANQNRKLV